MSEADKVWFRQEIRSAARQVLYEEFGEVLQYLRAVKEKGDMDAVQEWSSPKLKKLKMEKKVEKMWDGKREIRMYRFTDDPSKLSGGAG